MCSVNMAERATAQLPSLPLLLPLGLAAPARGGTSLFSGSSQYAGPGAPGRIRVLVVQKALMEPNLDAHAQ